MSTIELNLIAKRILTIRILTIEVIPPEGLHIILPRVAYVFLRRQPEVIIIIYCKRAIRERLHKILTINITDIYQSCGIIISDIYIWVLGY